MLNKIKSTFNNVKNKINCPKAETCRVNIYNMWKKLSDFVKASLDLASEKLIKAQISANFVSIFGFLIGVFAINFLSLEYYGYALVCILINRLFDALDGAIARKTKVTDFGIFLDATLDYMFYAGVIFGFALADPYQNAVAASFLLFAFAASACAMLAYAIIAYKKPEVNKAELQKSPFYLCGFAQGFETLTAFVVLCIVPQCFLQIAILLGVLCLIKALSILITAYYSFEIAGKRVSGKKKND